MEKGEINFLEIIKILYESRSFILKTIFIFLILGLCVSFFSEKEYTASVTVVPLSADSKNLGGNIGGLAATFGINLSGMSGEAGIQPVLYPKIVNSIPFKLELLKTPLTIDGVNKKISYFEYYSEEYKPSILGYLKMYTIGLPGLIKKVWNSDDTKNKIKEANNFFSVTDEEKLMLDRFEDQIVISVNEKEGFVKLSAKLPEAKAAAELVSNAQKILQNYIIEFKIEKSKEQLKFVGERYKEKENEFKTVQEKLANFRDQNQKITSSLAQTRMEELQSEYDLAFSVFVELAKQYETQQIKVKQDTPIFTIIEPISIPYERSFPRRGMIMISFLILGVVIGALGVGVSYLKEYLKNN
uniref:Wzz/FepE/Etk N-terminal domain-containing protein n=1 Tax=Polaribacter sp. TaxID=1920175 RepID=UPI0040482924